MDDEVFYVRKKINTGCMSYDVQEKVYINKYTIKINNEVESRLRKKIDTTTELDYNNISYL